MKLRLVSALARRLCLAAGLLGGMAAAAPELPQSDACRLALQELEQAESALMAASAASSAADPEERQRRITARLFPQRQRVADACLGGLSSSAPPSRGATPPALPRQAPVPAPRVQPPLRPEALPPLSLPRPEPPLSIGSCNAASCVTSDGSTLTRVGPMLLGPRGLCTRQGVFVSCP